MPSVTTKPFNCIYGVNTWKTTALTLLLSVAPATPVAEKAVASATNILFTLSSPWFLWLVPLSQAQASTHFSIEKTSAHFAA
jgi:hypothetical protein